MTVVTPSGENGAAYTSAQPISPNSYLCVMRPVRSADPRSSRFGLRDRFHRGGPVSLRVFGCDGAFGRGGVLVATLRGLLVRSRPGGSEPQHEATAHPARRQGPVGVGDLGDGELAGHARGELPLGGQLQ